MTTGAYRRQVVTSACKTLRWAYDKLQDVLDNEEFICPDDIEIIMYDLYRAVDSLKALLAPEQDINIDPREM